MHALRKSNLDQLTSISYITLKIFFIEKIRQALKTFRIKD
jgi:hypothetical protein